MPDEFSGANQTRAKQSPARPSTFARDLAAILTLAAVYFASGKFGLSLAFINASASAVWPPTGIALAILLLFGLRLWPGIFIGAFLVNITTQGSVPTTLGIAAGNTLEGIAGVWVIFQAGIAFPGTFILDRDARVKSRFFEDFYIERNTASSIMARVGVKGAPGGNVGGTQVSTEHLQLRTYPSDAAVAPGNRFAITFEITPRPRMHVYAPGASGYRIISVKISPQPFLRVLPLKYPASQIYFFKPLNERVPVYAKSFTLIQELILEGQPEAQASSR